MLTIYKGLFTYNGINLTVGTTERGGAEGGRTAEEGKMLTLADPFRSAPSRPSSTFPARERPWGEGGGEDEEGGNEEGGAGVIYEHSLTPLK